MKRTCKPKWNGIKVLRTGEKLNSETITDIQAIDLISRKILAKKDFIKLPKEKKETEKK